MNNQLLILCVIGRGNVYGSEIRQRVIEITGEDFSIGGLYPTLYRLVAKGFIKNTWGDNKTLGARRRYYGLTVKGINHCKQIKKLLKEF